MRIESGGRASGLLIAPNSYSHRRILNTRKPTLTSNIWGCWRRCSIQLIPAWRRISIYINGNESVAGNDLTHIRISQHIRKQCSKGILYNFMISTHLKYIFISLWSRWWIIHFIWEKETQFIDAVTRTIKNKRCSVLGYWESFYGPLTFPKDE